MALKAVDSGAAAPARRNDLFASTSTSDAISSTHTQELVIALCGPIGSPLHEVAEKLREMLQRPFGYTDSAIG